MSRALTIFGAILLIAGAFWALQGAGIIMWPAESFMLAQNQWVWYGSLTALVGAVMIFLGRPR